MTSLTTTVSPALSGEVVQARAAGFLHDLTSIASRALRAVPRDPPAVIPPVFIALFFFIVNIATLKNLAANHPGFSYTPFETATALLLAAPVSSPPPPLSL